MKTLIFRALFLFIFFSNFNPFPDSLALRHYQIFALWVRATLSAVKIGAVLGAFLKILIDDYLSF